MTDVDFPAVTLCEDHGSDTGEYVRNVFNNLKFPDNFIDKDVTVGKKLWEEFHAILQEFVFHEWCDKLLKSLEQQHRGFTYGHPQIFGYSDDDAAKGLVLNAADKWFTGGSDSGYVGRDVTVDFGTFVDRVGRLASNGVGKKVQSLCDDISVTKRNTSIS